MQATDAPATGELHLWWADLDASARVVEDASLVLGPDERERVSRLRRPEDRSRAVMRRAVLRRLLGAYLDADPAALPLAAGAAGRPVCPDADGRLAFNLSSSGPVALYAFTRGGRVGVDVEYRADGEWEELPAHLFLAGDEARAIASAPAAERRHRVAVAWVLKEAVAKGTGVGAAAGLEDIVVAGEAGPLPLTLRGAWSTYASPDWQARVVEDDGRRLAAVAVDGPWSTTRSRHVPAPSRAGGRISALLTPRVDRRS